MTKRIDTARLRGMNLDKEYFLLFLLMILSGGLLLVTLEQVAFDIAEPINVVMEKEAQIISLSSLTLKQKIAQMLIVYGSDKDTDLWQKMMVGGIYLEAKLGPDDFKKSINRFQSKAAVPFLVTADMEGCRNPFENFKVFPTFKEIQNTEEAYTVGKEEGQLMKELGFTMNLAPVVDLEDTIWGCRSFSGNAEEVAEKAQAYISGLNSAGIMSVAKHYPGQTLRLSDTHKEVGEVEIEAYDLLPFDKAIEQGVSGIMVSHLIVSGEVDSREKPGVVSPELIADLKNKFTGLVITDEIGMLGLRNYYTNNLGQTNFKQIFVDLFKTNNDIILTFDRNPQRIYSMIGDVEEAVLRGEISPERIDDSVQKILSAKGWKVIE